MPTHRAVAGSLGARRRGGSHGDTTRGAPEGTVAPPWPARRCGAVCRAARRPASARQAVASGAAPLGLPAASTALRLFVLSPDCDDCASSTITAKRWPGSWPICSGDDRELLQRGDDDRPAGLGLAELARGVLDVLHHPEGLLELPEGAGRVLNQVALAGAVVARVTPRAGARSRAAGSAGRSGSARRSCVRGRPLPRPRG